MRKREREREGKRVHVSHNTSLSLSLSPSLVLPPLWNLLPPHSLHWHSPVDHQTHTVTIVCMRMACQMTIKHNIQVLTQTTLTSMLAKVGRSWSKKGSKAEPCVLNNECIRSAIFLIILSSSSSCKRRNREREREGGKEDNAENVTQVTNRVTLNFITYAGIAT